MPQSFWIDCWLKTNFAAHIIARVRSLGNLSLYQPIPRVVLVALKSINGSVVQVVTRSEAWEPPTNRVNSVRWDGIQALRRLWLVRLLGCHWLAV